MEKDKKQLLDFFMWFRENGEKYVCSPIEHMIEIYLKENDEKQV